MFLFKKNQLLRAVWLFGFLFYFAFYLLQPVQAAIVRNYAVRFSTNDTGDIALIGNKLSSCNQTVSNCTNAINGIGSTLNNNSFNMVHVDIDGDPSTFNSSSATLTLPAGSTVLWAGLYWGGDINNGTANADRAKLRVPGTTSYTTITATQLDSTASQVAGRTRYQGFAPVTAQIKAAGSGSYTVADVQATSGNTDSYAAWALVVVYQDTSRPLRNLTVFDGFAFVTTSDPAVSIPVSGFTTPLSGPVNTKIGAVIYEGDLGLTGDTMRLNATTLSDAQNPSNNFFNSTISNQGARITSKNPDDINQMAFDADIVNANGILANGSNNATIQLNTTSDAYYPGMISFVTDLHSPQLAGNIIKSVVDVNGGQVQPNDILQYTISLANTGLDGATNVILRDPIPANSTYLPNSLSITAGANSGNKSDTSGNDQAEYDSGQNRVVFRLGTGANATNGGTLSVGASTTIRFQVRVNTPLANATVITNQASVSYNAATTGQSFTSPSNPVSVVVVSASQLSVTKQDAVVTDTAPLGPSPGDTLRYTVQINNSGNADATGVSFSDIPGANTTLVNTSVTTSQGTITSGNTGETAVGVNLGTIAGLGGSATITFEVLIANPVPSGVVQVVNQGFLSSNELPPVPTDDPDTALAGDATITPITAAPVIVAYKTDTLFFDADGDGVPSPNDTIEYVISIVNSGNQGATGIVFDDTPDANGPLIVGSVTTSQGTITNGNVVGDSRVTVNVGALSGGSSATVRFLVTIDDPLPVGVTALSNQGFVSSNELPLVRSDDPETAVLDDATMTPVTAFPSLYASKTASLAIDADGDGVPSPGDTVHYQIILQNNGNAAATGIIFTDTPDIHTTLVVGSVQTGQGAVVQGNTVGDTAVLVDVVTLLGGSNAAIGFDVVINSGLSTAVTQVANQGTVSSNELPVVPTDDPETAVSGDPTVTAITATPKLSATKQDILFIDADNDGQPSPGDTLLYQVTIANTGNAIVQNVNFNDTPDVYTSLVIGSVQVSTGSVNSGNGIGDTEVDVAIGTIPVGGSVTIAFEATINTPLPMVVARVVNQGIVSSLELPPVLTDDPDTSALDDPTVTPVTSSPHLLVTKTASLWVDADGDGMPTAGDTLTYQIIIANHGNAAATGIILDDQVDSQTTLIPFSVQTTQGSILTGNAPGDTEVQVDLGTLPANNTAIVAFQVTIRTPLPVGVTEVANQAVVHSIELPTILSDDPSTLPVGDPTVVLVVSEPKLLARKSDSLWVDADADGQPSPGDTLLYSIRIANTGHSAATLVVFTDSPDSNTALVVGSVQTDRGTIVTGNTAGDTSVQIDVGDVPAGSSLTIAFQVIIDDPFPGGVTFVSNQGIIASNELPDVPTDNPTTSTPNDPTITPVTAVPLLDVVKSDSLLVDADGDEQPSPGDTLLYNVTIRNTGNTSATNVIFTDTPGAYTTLVAGTVSTNRGTISSGNGGGETAVTVDIDTIPANRSAQISFEVTINTPLPAGVTDISNQGFLTSDELGTQPTDDPDSAASLDATITPIHAAPNLSIEKSDGGANAVLESTITYTLTYSNMGSQAATGVVITETVPDDTTFNSALSDPAWSCNGIVPGSICTYAVGNLAVGESGAIEVVLNINSSVPAGTTTIRNVAMIEDDGANGPDLNYNDNSSSDDARLYTTTAVTLDTISATPNRKFPQGSSLLFSLIGLATIWVLLRQRRHRSR